MRLATPLLLLAFTSAAFAQAPVPPGKVIGATDKAGTAPVADPVSIEDILRTVFDLMGIDANKSYLTPLGRPVPLVNGGKIVASLL